MRPDQEDKSRTDQGTCFACKAANSYQQNVTKYAGDAQPYHFLSRYFAPWIGVGEDAVTGSAHTALGPYWASQLNMFGQPMQARQCSARGGDLQITVDKDNDKVVLAAQAVIVSTAKLNLPL